MNAQVSAASFAPNMQLPWESSFDIDYRFKRILRPMLVLLCVCGLAIPFIEVPEKERAEKEKLPPQLARVILEEKKLPPPVIPPKPKPKPVEAEKPKPKPKKPVEKKPAPVKTVAQARQAAASTGLLKFKDELQALRENNNMADIKTAQLSRGTATAAKLERAIITSGKNSTSGGITTASLSRDTGGRALSGHQTTQVAAPVDTKGRTSNKARPYDSNMSGGRSEEDISQVMDANKGAIYAIYNRALRKNPGLQGKVTIKLVIQPTGAVSSASIVSSELYDPALEKKLLARVRLINFGAADVATTTLNYSFEFLPF